MVKVKRSSDGKVFTTDMSKEEGIYEMHFCTSYTQVMIQELDEDGRLITGEIICPPVGTKPNFVDLIAIQYDETGEILGSKQAGSTVKEPPQCVVVEHDWPEYEKVWL